MSALILLATAYLDLARPYIRVGNGQHSAALAVTRIPLPIEPTDPQILDALTHAGFTKTGQAIYAGETITFEVDRLPRSTGGRQSGREHVEILAEQLRVLRPARVARLSMRQVAALLWLEMVEAGDEPLYRITTGTWAALVERRLITPLRMTPEAGGLSHRLTHAGRTVLARLHHAQAAQHELATAAAVTRCATRETLDAQREAGRTLRVLVDRVNAAVDAEFAAAARHGADVNLIPAGAR